MELLKPKSGVFADTRDPVQMAVSLLPGAISDADDLC